MPPLLEVCIDCFESAVAAIRGGADRLELCAALSEGGLTPSPGLLVEVRNYLRENHPNSAVQLYAMIRCRWGNDFHYSPIEMRIMLHDLAVLADLGADGFVFGALTEDGEIHAEQCAAVVAAAKNSKKPVTFHRAFDCTDRSKMVDNLRLIESLGFTTVLTSGFESAAFGGLDNLVEMVDCVGSQIIIMPGSGISPGNAREIVQRTNCKAIHASARSIKKAPNRSSLSMGSNTNEGEGRLVCDETIVREIKKQINSS